jgi:hypothetical protein
LLAEDCKETAVMPATLPPRPSVRRATFASKPTHRHHARTAHKIRKPVRRKHISKHAGGKHRPKHRAHRPRHRPTAASPRIRRVTYASPLCGERSSAMNTMLGLPEYTITQPPEAATAPAIEDAVLDAPPVLGSTNGGGGGPTGPILIFPGGPVFPIGPGPVITVPPVGPVGPVTPPVTPGAVPEPTSWATMMLGMALIGGAIRRRRRQALTKA